MSHKRSFERFHRANPHVYAELKARALALKEAGVTRGSIGQLFEVLRYDHAIQTQNSEFKLNNNHRAFYARVLMFECKELEGFFAVRGQWEGDYIPDLVYLGLRAKPQPKTRVPAIRAPHRSKLRF